MNFSIRKAKAGDASELADLLRSLEWFSWIKEAPLEMAREHAARNIAMCSASGDHLMLVAENENGTIAGYCSTHWVPYLILNGPEGMVSELFIRAEARGQGIGTRLLAEVKAEGRKRGCSRLMLLNNRTRESYLRGFYIGDGWKEREAMANFIYDFSAE
jgi:GNAT superfamily N-acetyltransferase